jgi:hypothetical protein
MKNLAASIHARLAQRRAKTGEDYNVLLLRFTLERLLYLPLVPFPASGAVHLERGDALRALGTDAAPRHAGFGSARLGLTTAQACFSPSEGQFRGLET